MIMPNPERSPLEQVLKLVEQLSPEERKELRQKLEDKTWGERFTELVQDVAEDTKDLPPLTEEEIAQQVTAYRREKPAQSA